jgi:hypothetical protein
MSANGNGCVSQSLPTNNANSIPTGFITRESNMNTNGSAKGCNPPLVKGDTSEPSSLDTYPDRLAAAARTRRFQRFFRRFSRAAKMGNAAEARGNGSGQVDQEGCR